MLRRWFQDWRERRAALAEVEELRRADEAILMDQSQNPLNLAMLAAVSNPAEAVVQWERAKQLVPRAVLKSDDSLEILLALERYDEAEALMRERSKWFPRDGFPLQGLAMIAERRGDFEEALKRWAVLRDRVRDTVYGYHGCGRCLVALGRLDEADAQFAAALRRISHNLEANQWRAIISDRKKDWETSLKRWDYTAETFGFAPGYASHAKALMELGRLDEAEVYLERKSRMFPSELGIAETRAHLAQRRGDLTVACERWATVRATAPFFHAGYYEGARRLSDAARHAEADEVLRGAIERFPDEVWPLRDFARLAHARGDAREAAIRWASLQARFAGEDAGFIPDEAAMRATAGAAGASRPGDD